MATRRTVESLRAMLLLALAGAAACSGGTAASADDAARLPAPVAIRSTERPDAWVERTLAGMSLEAKVGQLLMARILGDFDNVAAPEMVNLRRMIEELGIGGVTVSIGSPPEIATKTNALQRFSELPLLIAADLEYGPGMRLWTPVYLPYVFEGGGGTVFPYNMGLGAIGDPLVAEAAGRVTAREARAVGIHWIFGPTIDVNNNPANPVINVRSYGSDPAMAALLGAAFVRGAEAAGALTAAKHFPGHGDTGLDSHIEMPSLTVPRARLDSVELPPFRAAVAAGASGIMTGHLAVPGLTAGELIPATLSRDLTERLLRDDLGFEGLIVTDALTMGALARLPGYSAGEVAVRAFEAGADVLLGPPDLFAAQRALLAAVRDGRIAESRIDASVRRILAAKARLGLHAERFVDVDSVTVVVSSAEHERIAADAARRSIVLVRDPAGIVPLDPRRTGTVAAIAFGTPTDLTIGRPFFAGLDAQYRAVRTARFDEDTPEPRIEEFLREARSADAVILAMYLSPISGKGHLRVPDRAHAIAARLQAMRKPFVVVSFGDPYGPATIRGAGAYMLAWQPRGQAAGRAAARALAGAAPITGTLPIELGDLPRGSGLQRGVLARSLPLVAAAEVGMEEPQLKKVDALIEAAIADGATPGAALAVGRNGKLVRLRGYGALDWKPGSAPVTDSTLYDIASLTKVVGTTTAAMMLVDQGELDLDAPVKRYVPEWSGSPAKEAVTVRQLLVHTSGLPAFAALYRELRGKKAYVDRIAGMPLQYQPGEKTVYSDFGVIMLGEVLERIANQPLDRFLQTRLFGPLGMRDTRFNPLPGCAALRPPEDMAEWENTAGSGAADPLRARIAPTEVDTIFRHTHVHGIVHDENACAMGGVAPHAGLFSSARDLALFAQLLLNEGELAGQRLIRAETVRDFTRRQSPASSRGIGWDTQHEGSSAGTRFGPRSFGHTGFTGTSMWMDPDAKVFVVLLTNRVNPSRANSKHVPLRRAVHDAVASSSER